MLSLVETIAKALVTSPDEVAVREISSKGDSIVIELKVAEKDMGKVIGKQGRIAKALRTVVKAAATKQNKKVKGQIQSRLRDIHLLPPSEISTPGPQAFRLSSGHTRQASDFQAFGPLIFLALHFADGRS